MRDRGEGGARAVARSAVAGLHGGRLHGVRVLHGGGHVDGERARVADGHAPARQRDAVGAGLGGDGAATAVAARRRSASRRPGRSAVWPPASRP